MPLHSLFRIASILAVVLIWVQWTDSVVWRSFVYSLSLGHVFMALVYSKKQITQVMDSPYSLLKVFGSLVVSFAMYLTGFSLGAYFAIHHAFSEVYLLDRVTGPKDRVEVKALRTSALVLNFLMYFFILRHLHYLLSRSAPFLFIALILSYTAFFYCLNRVRTSLSLAEFIDNCTFEIMGLGLIAASLFVKITFLQIICYHFLFWMVFPLPKIINQGRRELVRYVGLTALITGGLLLFSPIGLVELHFSELFFQNQFLLWSYVHITTSFVLSDAQPKWITHGFRPARSGA